MFALGSIRLDRKLSLERFNVLDNGLRLRVCRLWREMTRREVTMHLASE